MELKETVRELESKLEKLENEVVPTVDEETSQYLPEFKNLVYALLSHHVGSTHVRPVIAAVLQYASKQPSKLPSKSAISNWNIERLAIAQRQLSEELESRENLCLYSDETSKFGQRYMTYGVSDCNQRNYVLGLRDIATKSAKDSLDTFKEILADLDDAIATDTTTPGKEILCNIRSTMSDRAATEAKFVELLEHFRGEVLPQIKEHFQTLSEDGQNASKKLYTFFCGLHSLIQYAETATSVLKQCEDAEDIGPLGATCIVKADEAGTLRLLRTATKAFARGADEQAGVYYEFSLFAKDFLQEHHLRQIPLVKF